MAMEFWLKGIRQEGVSVELPEITLTRGRDGRKYKGPGSVTRTASGRLGLKLYSQFDFKEAFQTNQSPPGTLVQSADLYDLDAVDMHGYRWRAEGLWPDEDFSLPTGVAVVQAEPYRIVGTRPRPSSNGCHLSVAIHTDEKFPANQKEQIERKVGDTVLAAKYAWSAAEFDCDALHVQVVRDEELLVIKVSGQWDAERAEDLAGWVVSALQFTLGRRLIADVITLASGETQTQIVQSVDRDRMRPKIEPPRHWKSIVDSGITWNLFVAFLRFLQAAPRPTAKELCRWSTEVVDSGGAALEVSSLVLCVAVEGIVGLLQGEESTDEALRKDVADALQLAKGVAFPASLKPRILGVIHSMKTLRARDYLEVQVRQGVIPAELLEAWNSLRNSTAHADAAEEGWVGPVVRKSGLVLALYYRLVFLLIGYRGPYTDYGTAGWPERRMGIE